MKQEQFTDVSTIRSPSRPAEEAAPRLVPALTIVSHPVPQRAGERYLLEELGSGQRVAVSRIGPAFARPGETQGMPLADLFLSRKPLVLEPVPHGGVRVSLEDGAGQVTVGDEPLTRPREFAPHEVAQGIPLVFSERIVLLLHLALSASPHEAGDFGMVGYGAAIRRVREDISQVADLKVPVLVRGETGSGKELVAQAIHQASPRSGGPFVSVNLGAVAKELAAAELFGAHKGAYTGATQNRDGFFRAAHGGTLFLDEVGEAPPEVQVLLLRALETGEVFPVGGHTSVSVDVRLITATDANLEESIRKGSFKAPLLHRLAGYEIRVPPLRERREDIGVLFHHFARKELEAQGEALRLESLDPRAPPWIPPALAVRLVRYSWPGNIRQLRNLTRQIVIISRRLPTLKSAPHIDQELDSPPPRLPGEATSEREGSELEAAQEEASPRRKPSEVSDQELIQALRATMWNLRAAAGQLGITRASLYMLIDKSPSLRTSTELSAEEITACFHECKGDLDAMVQRLEVSKRGLRRRIKELGLEES